MRDQETQYVLALIAHFKSRVREAGMLNKKEATTMVMVLQNLMRRLHLIQRRLEELLSDVERTSLDPSNDTRPTPLIPPPIVIVEDGSDDG
jgi:hypothetical protein